MSSAFLIVALLYGGWSNLAIGNGGASFQGVTVGDGRNDGMLRVYGGSNDNHTYEYAFIDGQWVKTDMGTGAGEIHGLTVGKAHGDDTNRVYASCWSDGGAGPYEFTWNGSGWNQMVIGSGYDNTYDTPLGTARGDDTVRLYTGTNYGYGFELTWRGGTWTATGIGGSSASSDGSQHDMYLGYGHNDDTLRVYGACTDGNLWEFTFRAGGWRAETIGNIGVGWGVCVAQARRDGLWRVYAAGGAEGSPGGIYEYTWENGTWARLQVGSASGAFYGLDAGTGRNDDTVRVYGGSMNGHLYEYTWLNDSWQSFDCGQTQSGFWLHDVYLAPGRNDDTVRVYVAGGDSRVHEYTYRPDAGVRVDPDDSATTNPSVAVIYPLWVVNTGSHADTLDLSIASTLAGWSARLIDLSGEEIGDSDSDGKPDVGALPSGDSTEIRLEITPPSSATAGTRDSTRVWGASSLYPAVRDSALLITIVGQVSGLLVDPDQDTTILAGQSVDYPLIVRNESNSQDLVDLTAGGTLPSWDAALLDENGAPLSDSDSDGDSDVGPLNPNQQVNIILRITAPADAEGGTVDISRVTGRLNLDPTITESATLTTTIRTIPEVKIVEDSTDSTPAGVPIRYRAVVTNLGNRRDAVNLLAFSSQGWTWSLYDSIGNNRLDDSDGDSYMDAGEIAPYGDSVLLWIEIAPPATARHNTLDTTYLVAFSSIDPAVRDSIRLVTRALNLLPAVVVEPDTAGVVEAGNEIIYSMRVINAGNEPDSFEIWTVSDLAWQTELSTDYTGTMNAMETLAVVLTITTPAELASIVGTPAERNTEHRLLWARSLSDESVLDSAVIVTLAVPPLDIHNYPNPFSGQTTFIYSIPADGEATLSLYNRAGEHIKTFFSERFHSPGIYTEGWDGLTEQGRVPAPGVYIYVLEWRAADAKGLFKTQRIAKTALLQP